MRGHFARCIYLDLCLHGGVGRGIFVCYDQQLVEDLWLIAEKLVLEEGAFSAPGGEVLDSLYLVHALAGVPELGPTREVVASRLVGALHAQGKLARLGRRLPFRLPFRLLGFNGRDLPAAGSRLRGLALVVALLLLPITACCWVRTGKNLRFA